MKINLLVTLGIFRGCYAIFFLFVCLIFEMVMKGVSHRWWILVDDSVRVVQFLLDLSSTWEVEKEILVGFSLT
jgi:hypothetical protein